MYGKILLWAWSNMIIDYKKIFILIILIFLGFADVQAANAYKNELTKVSLSPIGSGDVKVTLYMSKPYTEPLRLLKKNDGEFLYNGLYMFSTIRRGRRGVVTENDLI